MKTIVLMALLLAVGGDDGCRIAEPLDQISAVNCSLKQESHGWKLWGVIGTKDKAEHRYLLAPGQGRLFWDDDDKAFGRCKEWRKCVTAKISKARLAPSKD